MKKFFSIILLAVIALGFNACNSDSGTDLNPSQNIFLNIVTYEGASITGGSTFSLQKSGDSPLITLTTTQNLGMADVPVGTRIIMSYVPESGVQYVSGPITVYQAANIEGGGAAVTEGRSENTTNWASNEVAVQLVERTGPYLNLQFTGSLPTGVSTANIKFLVDEKTLDDAYPEIHLILGPYNTSLDKTYIFYGSWNISNIWERPTCKGVKVCFNGTSTYGSAWPIDKITLTPGN